MKSRNKKASNILAFCFLLSCLNFSINNPTRSNVVHAFMSSSSSSSSSNKNNNNAALHHHNHFQVQSKLFSVLTSSRGISAAAATSSSVDDNANKDDFFKTIVEGFSSCIPSPTRPSSSSTAMASSSSSSPFSPFSPSNTASSTSSAAEAAAARQPNNMNSAPHDIDSNYNYYYNKINKNGKQRALLNTLNDFETFLSSELHEINHQRIHIKQQQQQWQRNPQSSYTSSAGGVETIGGVGSAELVTSPRLNTKEYNDLLQTLTILHSTYFALLKTRGSKHPRAVKTLQKLIQGYLHPTIVNNPNTPKEHFINAKNTLEDILQTKSTFDTNPTQQETQKLQIQKDSYFAQMNSQSIHDPVETKMKRIHTLYKNDFIIFQSLAFIYMKLQLFNQAKEMYTDVMYELQSVALGPYHPDTLKTLHHIANVYSTMNDYENARKYYLTCYVHRKNTLGSIHEDTISTLQQLSNLYLCHGKYYQAYVLCEKCYTNIVTYGNTDIITPNTALMTFHNLALYYQQENKLEKSKTLYEKCVLQQIKTLGCKDVDTLLTLHNLSTLYHDLGEYTKGIQTCQLCFMLRRDVLGLYHYDTIMTLCNLGMLYECQGKVELAKSIYEVCLDVQVQTLGLDDSDTKLTLESLKRLSSELGVIKNGSSYLDSISNNGLNGIMSYGSDSQFTFGGSAASAASGTNGEGTGVTNNMEGRNDNANRTIRSRSGLQNGLKKSSVQWNDDDAFESF